MISQLNITKYLTRCSKLLLALVVFSLSIGQVSGQGWERIFGGTKIDEGYEVIETRDLGYLVVGFSESFGGDNDLDVYVLKTDIDGTEEWSFEYDEAYIEHAYDAIEAPDGGIIVVGDIINNVGEKKEIYILKIDPEGKFLWSKQYGLPEMDEVGRKVARGIGGGYIITGETVNPETEDQDVLVLKIDENGEEEWLRSFGTAKDDRGQCVVTLDDQYIVAGYSENPGGVDNDIKIFTLDRGGNVLSEQEIKSNEDENVLDMIATRDGGFAITGYVSNNNNALIAKFNAKSQQEWLSSIDLFGLADQGQSIIELKNGHFIIAGFTEQNEINVDFFLAEFDRTGNEIWVNSTGNPVRTDFAGGLTVASNGGYVFTGRSAKVLDFFDDVVLIKTDRNGDTFTSFIEGNIYGGEACNNFIPNGDLPLEGWLVRADGQDKSFFGTSNAQGDFSIRVDTGEYHVTVYPINNYWKPCVPGGYIVNVNRFYSTTEINFPITGEINCPYLEVDVSTPFLAPCDEPIEYTVSYCNLGTAVAEDAYVEVSIDDELTFNASSIAYNQQTDNKYYFDLGDLPVSHCGNFTINTSLTCETPIAQGQAMLVSARIFPDTICTEPDPNWDGSSVIVRGQCQGDSLYFEIENVGEGSMQAPKNYIVIEENVIFFEEPFQLDVNEVLSMEPIEATGKTYRIVAEQSDGHPGRSFPTFALEGCGGDGTNFSTGLLAQFREDDLDPFVSVDVQEYNPSSEVAILRGYPKGYGEEGLISPQTDITYTITFSNFGVDTVDRVVIRDTLPKSLDVSSFVPGASSHPYTYEIYGEGIVKFTFSKISLVPIGSSATYEQRASSGFVTFTLSQNPENPKGATITNRAAIFFENQKPVSTNKTLNIVQEFPGYVEDRTNFIPDQRFGSDFKVVIAPNPFVDYTNIEVAVPENWNQSMSESVYFEVFDMVGRKIKSDYFFISDTYRFFRGQLSRGLYAYRLSLKGEIIGSGKLLIE